MAAAIKAAAGFANSFSKADADTEVHVITFLVSIMLSIYADSCKFEHPGANGSQETSNRFASQASQQGNALGGRGRTPVNGKDQPLPSVIDRTQCARKKADLDVQVLTQQRAHCHRPQE